MPKPPSRAQRRGINHACGSAMKTHSLAFNRGLQFVMVRKTPKEQMGTPSRPPTEAAGASGFIGEGCAVLGQAYPHQDREALRVPWLQMVTHVPLP